MADLTRRVFVQGIGAAVALGFIRRPRPCAYSDTYTNTYCGS